MKNPAQWIDSNPLRRAFCYLLYDIPYDSLISAISVIAHFTTFVSSTHINFLYDKVSKNHDWRYNTATELLLRERLSPTAKC